MPMTSVAVHTFPECRDSWMKLDSATQEHVLAFAAQIWDAPRHQFDHNSLETLRELASMGVILQEAEEWRFATAPMLFYAQSIHMIELHSMDGLPPSDLLRILEDASGGPAIQSQRDFADWRSLVSFIIAQLVNEYHRLDLVELVLSEETSDDHFWLMQDRICDSLPILDLTVEEFAIVLKGIAVRAQRDMAGGGVYWAAEYLGYFRPDFALKLVDHFSADDGWQDVGFLERLMTGIARASASHRDAVIAEAEVWLSSGEASRCQAGVYLSGNLVSNGQLQPEWLLSRAGSLVSRPEEEIRYATAIVIIKLGGSSEEHSEECLSILARLKELGPLDQVAHGICVGLAPKDSGTLDYTMSCLNLVVDIPVANKGTVKRIGWLLYPIARADPAHVWRYLEKWILAHKLQESVSEYDMFLSTIENACRNDRDLTTLVLTRWFCSSDLRLVEEARNTLRELRIDSFHPAEIASLPARTILYLSEKVLVGRLLTMQMLRLFSSILLNTGQIRELRDYFSRALRYLSWSLPGSCEELFDELTGESDTEATSLLERARKELLEYQEARKGIFAAELAPSRRRVQRYQEFEGKQMQQAYKSAQESDRFPFQKFLRHVRVGRGDRSFHMNIFHPEAAQRRTFTEPTGFGEISQSLELPRGEFLDPEGEVWRRAQRLSRKPDDNFGESL